MEMIPVQSSNVAAVGYEGGLLRVQFRDGKEYEYAGVSEAEYVALMTSPSKGNWLYAYRREKLIASGSVPSKEEEKTEVPAEDYSFAVVK